MRKEKKTLYEITHTGPPIVAPELSFGMCKVCNKRRTLLDHMFSMNALEDDSGHCKECLKDLLTATFKNALSSFEKS